MLRLLLFVLPLGFDTLGVSISLGIKSQPHDKSGSHHKWGSYVECGDPAWGTGNIQHVSTNCLGGSWGNALPAWVSSALLFSLAETVMPLVGLTIGYAVSLFVSSVMHILGPLLLIGVGLWELLEEVHERISKGKEHKNLTGANAAVPSDPISPAAGAEKDTVQRLGRQLLLALSVSVDELAIGFSLGAITSGTLSGGQVIPGSQTINTITLCILIGLQGFLMTLIGLTLGRTLRIRLKFVKEWIELLSCFLLIALGVWLLIT